MTTYAGIDAGGTLIKVAYLKGCSQSEDQSALNHERKHNLNCDLDLTEAVKPDRKQSLLSADAIREEQKPPFSWRVPELLKFESSQIEEAACWLRENLPPDTRIGCTGGQGERLRVLLPEYVDFEIIPEFEATAEGAVRILQAESCDNGVPAARSTVFGGAVPESLSERFVLVNVGTGTSLHLIDGAERPRLGGIGLGGGTIVGLTGLLCGVRDYREIARLAPLGDREAVDLTVGQIYAPAQPPIAGDLTAANFARPLPPEGGAQPQDYAAAVIGMVAKIVTTVGVQAAKLHGARRVVYVGSSYENNALLHELTVRFTAMLGLEAVIPAQGAYSGAVGALYTAMRP